MSRGSCDLLKGRHYGSISTWAEYAHATSTHLSCLLLWTVSSILLSTTTRTLIDIVPSRSFYAILPVKMNDHYQYFLSSMNGVPAPPNQSPQDAHSLAQQQASLPIATPAMSNFHQSLGYYTGFPDPMVYSAPKAQRSRRKSAPGLEHIKHRRTRSGCFTCRSRRVKVWNRLYGP